MFPYTLLLESNHLVSLVPFLLRLKAGVPVQALGRHVVLVDLEEDPVVTVGLGVGQDAVQKGTGETGPSEGRGHHEGGEVQGPPAIRFVRAAKGRHVALGKPGVVAARGAVLGQKVGDRERSLTIGGQERGDSMKSVGRPGQQRLQRWDSRGREKCGQDLGQRMRV